MADTAEHRIARLTPAATVRIQRQKELKPKQIPLGTCTVVAGIAGEGKSSYLVDVTARASMGQLEGDFAGTKVASIWVNIEDDPGRVQVPRLKAAGADLDQVYFLTIDSTIDEETRESIPSLPMDIEPIRAAIIESGAQLVVLDPASSLMSGDLNKRDDARRSLDVLSALAQDLEIAIVLVLHFGKGRGSASEKISGSHALRDAVRSVLLVARDDETGNRIITLDKSNYSPHVGQSWAFDMIDTEVTTDDGEVVHVGRVVDLGETDVSVGDIINREAGDDAREDRNAAQEFVLDFLVNSTPHEAKAGDVLKAGRAAGFTDQDIKDARRRSRNPKILSVKSGFGAGWVWQLAAEGGTEGGEDGAYSNAATFATFVPPSIHPSNVTPLLSGGQSA